MSELKGLIIVEDYPAGLFSPSYLGLGQSSYEPKRTRFIDHDGREMDWLAIINLDVDTSPPRILGVASSAWVVDQSYTWRIVTYRPWEMTIEMTTKNWAQIAAVGDLPSLLILGQIPEAVTYYATREAERREAMR